jgi:probable 2-oxoglutarate dehydrogenase E1 component DHKTD1
VKNATLMRFVDNVRLHGHRAASVDPLDLLERMSVSALDPSRYGLENGKEYNIDGIIWQDGSQQNWTLERIVDHMRDVYVGKVGYEYMHSISKTERLWFSNLLESSSSPTSKRSKEEKKRIYELLVKSEVFDRFLQLKFPNLKRYGLEGGESMLPGLDTLFKIAASGGYLNLTGLRILSPVPSWD